MKGVDKSHEEAKNIECFLKIDEHFDAMIQVTTPKLRSNLQN